MIIINKKWIIKITETLMTQKSWKITKGYWSVDLNGIFLFCNNLLRFGAGLPVS